MKRIILTAAVLMLFGISTATAQEIPGEDALVVYFPFDEDVNDESGNGNDGILHCQFAAAPDRHGNPDGAMFFDGDNDYIEVPTSDTFNIESELTISFWLNRESLQNQGSGDAYVFSLDPVFGGTSLYVRLSSDSDDGTVARLLANSSPAFNVPLGEWVHFVIVADTSLKLYMNGTLAAQSPLLRPIMSGTLPLWIGSFRGLDFDYHGAMDDVMIFNRALTDEEVGEFVNLEVEPEEECIPISEIEECPEVVCEECEICSDPVVCPDPVVCEQCFADNEEECLGLCPAPPECFAVTGQECMDQCPLCEECPAPVVCEAAPEIPEPTDCEESTESIDSKVKKAKLHFNKKKGTTYVQLNLQALGIPEGLVDGPAEIRLQILQGDDVVQFNGKVNLNGHGPNLMDKYQKEEEEKKEKEKKEKEKKEKEKKQKE